MGRTAEPIRCRFVYGGGAAPQHVFFELREAIECVNVLVVDVCVRRVRKQDYVADAADADRQERKGNLGRRRTSAGISELGRAA